MTKLALCVDSYASLTDLVNKKVEFVEAKLIDREICEKPENGHQQLIPYVTLFNTDAANGKIKFIQYQRPDKTEGEERLAGKTSIGFGGHIDNIDEIVATETIDNGDGTTSFKMSLQDYIDTFIKCATRELKEELGMDVSTLGVDISKALTCFFHGDLSIEVNQVHLGVSVLVEVSDQQFEGIKANCKINEVEIQKLDTLGLNLDTIVEEMDLTVTLNNLCQGLVNNHGLEEWSARILNFVVRNEAFKLLKFATFKDMVAVSQAKEAIYKQQEAEKAAQAAAEGQEAQPAEVGEQHHPV